MPVILLDMDGVLCDLQPEIARLFGIPREHAERLWIPGEYEISDGLGLDPTEMWARLAMQGEDFWSGLPETPWARKLYAGVRAMGDVYFSTAPTLEPHSASGKLKWLQRFVGDKGLRNYLIGPPKWLCAKEGVALVDDSDHNVEAFAKAGGRGILLPRAWNSLHALRGDPCGHVLGKLELWEWSLRRS